MLKKILLIAAVLLPMFASAQTLKIGLVDSNSILQAMPETKEAETKLQEVQKKYQDQISQLIQEIQRLEEELKNMGADTPAAIRTQKETDYQQQGMKIQQFQQTAAQDLEKQQGELMMPIIQKIRTAITAVGQEESFSYIQMKDDQLVYYFAAPVEDITLKVKAKLGIQ